MFAGIRAIFAYNICTRVEEAYTHTPVHKWQDAVLSMYASDVYGIF